MKVYFDSLDRGYEEPIRRGFEFLGNSATVDVSTRVCIKPNLTFPTFRRGVMTSPEALEALIVYLKDFTSHITICESDSGGYNRFSMDEVFKTTGIDDFSKRYNIRVVNMSNEPARNIGVRCGMRRLQVPIPTLLLDETDLLITMPVPKVHANTVVSLAIKNQWGVIQEPALRLRLHPYFRDVIYQIHKNLPKTAVVMDGKYGLTRNGPMRGDVLELNWFLMSDSVYAADRMITRMMGIDYEKVPHLNHILRLENLESIDNVQSNVPIESFPTASFQLNREWTDLPGFLTFHSRLLAYIGYESFLARPLHWMLYRFREPFY